MELPPSIRVENLSRNYGKVAAISNVSFEVKRGEIVGFLGPNGAGKSTTMRILSGLLPAHSGSARVAGLAVSENPREVKKRIGYMLENNPLPEDMRVAEYLRFRAKLKQVPSRKVRQAVQDAMEICDLARTARRKIIGTLSKGFRQRVGIADSLLGNPEVILMDEPTIGLDPHQIQGIRQLIDSLRGRMTVILSSHILPEIERCCDRVIIINRGRIVACGTSSDLRKEFLPESRVDLVMQGDPSDLLATLKEAGMKAEIISSKTSDDGIGQYSLFFEDTTLCQSPDLLNILSRSELYSLISLAPRQPDMEEIFLAATKRSWEETIEKSRLPVNSVQKST
ncbi:MAG: ABC transporter ATP-binding protein [Coraliomargaritaceae bacterium]